MTGFTKSDWLLLALSKAQNGTMSPVQVQKALFVFRKGTETVLDNGCLYDFQPYDYGPFDAAIYSDLDAFEARGLVQIINPSLRAQRRYQITPDGISAINSQNSPDERFTAFMKDVVEWVQKQSFTSLIRSIYNKWPDYKKNSVFQDTASL